MHPDLEKLLDLQAKDLELLEADKALDGILAEYEALDQQLKGAQQAVDQAARSVTEAGRRREELEGKMETYRKLEERGKQRLEQVRTPKEIQAVMTEMDLARSVLAKEEADWMKLADVIAGLEQGGREAAARLAEMREGQVEVRAALDLRRDAAEARRWRPGRLLLRRSIARCAPATSGSGPSGPACLWRWTGPPAARATRRFRSTGGVRSGPEP
jgi:DNA-binding transcriptional ArsR family regulator